MLNPTLDPDIQKKVDAYINSLSGQAATMRVDRDFLLLRGNTDLFMLHYFPRDFTVWEPLNQRLIDFLEDNREGVVWLPGGHGKTTTLLRWKVKLCCVEPQISSIYVDKTEPSAFSRSRAILAILEGNKLLINDFGEFKSDTWSVKDWVIRQRPFHQDAPTLKVFGTGGAALGNRCNVLIVDDPVTTHNSASEAERATIFQWYTEAAATCPSPLPLSDPRSPYLKKSFLVGTTFHMDDLYHQVLQRDPQLPHLHLKAVDMVTGETLSGRFCFREPSLLRESAVENQADAKLLADIEAGRVENLYEFRRTKGIVAFNRRYQNEVIDPNAQRFSEVWFRGGTDEFATVDGYPGCVDRGRTMGEYVQGWRYVTGVDPASGSASKKAARFVAVTLGADPKEPDKIYLMKLDYGHYPLDLDNPNRKTQLGIIMDHVRQYNSRVALETNNIQKAYADSIKAEARRRGMVVSVYGHWTTKQGKIDPEMGVEAMAPMIENGKFSLPYAEVNDQRLVEEIINEFIGFPDVYPTKDIVMAIWFAWRVLKRQLKIGVSAYKPMNKPAYLQNRGSLVFPRQWTEEQREAYLRGSEPEEEEEDVAI